MAKMFVCQTDANPTFYVFLKTMINGGRLVANKKQLPFSFRKPDYLVTYITNAHNKCWIGGSISMGTQTKIYGGAPGLMCTLFFEDAN